MCRYVLRTLDFERPESVKKHTKEQAAHALPGFARGPFVRLLLLFSLLVGLLDHTSPPTLRTRCTAASYQLIEPVYRQEHKEYAVEPVEYTPVPRYQVAAVLHACGPLDERLAQVARDGRDADKQAKQHRLRDAQAQQAREREGSDYAAQHAPCEPFPGLGRADVRNQLVSP